MTAADREPQPGEQEPQGVTHERPPQFEPEEEAVFARALRVLAETGIPHALGGALALHAYTGIWRDTKDLDVFLKPADLATALRALAVAGFETSLVERHWLAKATREPYVVDLLFGTSHGRLRVDDAWFTSARTAGVGGITARVIPLEELLVSKLYIAVRDRFDGSDVVHLIRAARGRLDWQRVLSRLGDNRQLLLWHLILFDLVYPGHADYLPQELTIQLLDQMRARWSETTDPTAFRGTLLDPYAYTVDVAEWGYRDQRDLTPLVE
jgi:hypothetical protein